jgi:hypothetical protein
VGWGEGSTPSRGLVCVSVSQGIKIRGNPSQILRGIKLLCDKAREFFVLNFCWVSDNKIQSQPIVGVTSDEKLF